MTAGNDFVISGLPFNVLIYGNAGMGPVNMANIAFVGAPTINLPGGSPTIWITLSATGAASANVKVLALSSGTAAINGSFKYLF
jgi:hypothetical protein